MVRYIIYEAPQRFNSSKTCLNVCMSVSGGLQSFTILTMKIPPKRAAMNLLKRAAHRLAT